jgi:hypothetical protein
MVDEQVSIQTAEHTESGELMGRLDAGAQDLSTEEAAGHLKAYSPNAISEKKPPYGLGKEIDFSMNAIRKLKVLAGVYLSVLLLLLICVGLMPLIIRNGVSAARNLIIEEDVLETLLILLLFGFSFFLLRGLLNALRAYRHAADRAAQENLTLLTRLSEAFKYIGRVNVEIQEIRSILCGIDCYPQTKRELRRCFDHLADKAMTITGSQWVVIRMVDRLRGQTVKECRAERRKGALPAITMGNRDILEDRHIDGLAAIFRHPTNLEFSTVCILPERPIADVEHLLLRAILNQFEMLYLLHRSGCFLPSARHTAAIG